MTGAGRWQGPPSFRRLLLGAAVGVLVAGCAATTGDVATSPPSDTPVIVTFEVAEGERFRVLLTHGDDVATARRLLAGEDVPGIPNGRVIREPGVNVGWSWSLDPDDFEFADLTIEVCDGLPSEVEAGTLTSERYCPWSALAIEVAPAP